MYSRFLQPQIEASLFQGKVVVVYGARQVGKTTLVKNIQTKFPDSKYFNCDEGFVRQNLNKIENSNELKEFFGSHKLVIIDEAQRIQNIGLKLKLMVDNFPDTQLLVTGSSTLELGKEINEPLTGRKFLFNLYPLATTELNLNKFELKSGGYLEKILRFGLYPEVYLQSDENSARKRLNLIADSYLYKDILELVEIRNKETLEKLLQLLAFQIGSEASFTELAKSLNISQATVQHYISLLEEAFIIFRLPAFSRNLRSELVKTRKIYFYDLGVRNSLVQAFNTLNFRNDIGKLWENFLIMERMKYLQSKNLSPNIYFWRTYTQAEIDYIEEYNGELHSFEFKWNTNKKEKIPKLFMETYPNSNFKTINNENWLEFVGF